MSWKPRPGWLLVEPIETHETFRDGRIVIPQASRDRTAQWQYTVLEAGMPLEPEEDDDPSTPTSFTPGDWILCRPRSALHVEAERLWLVPEAQVWGRLNGSAGSSSPRSH